MSSFSDSDDEDGTHFVNHRGQQRRRVGNAFAGLNLHSDSGDDDTDDDDTNDEKSLISKKDSNKETRAILPGNEHHHLLDSGAEDSVSYDSNECDNDELNTALTREEITEFDDLKGCLTRHGTIIQADFVEAIKQFTGGAGSKPTEIQCECWTTLLLSPLTRHRDVICVSKTGSGKTLSFLVPLLGSLAVNDVSKHQPRNACAFVHPRAIILAPTRVLAQQIFEVASTLVQNTPSLASIKLSAALGGSSYHQQMADLLAMDPDLIVATPGRLNSLCGYIGESPRQDGTPEMCIQVDHICELVIDEADMMLALGFQDALSWFAELVNTSSEQGFRLVLTSATWEKATSANISQFESISNEEPVLLATEGAGRIVTKNVTQRVEVLSHKGAPRFNRLVQLLSAALQEPDSTTTTTSSRIIVFCPHKSQTRQMGKDLRAKGIANVILEGDMSQSARVAAINAFRNGLQGRRVLVATDVAARGLDVLNVSHVFNYSLGISIESYIHRCGRTGRAGRFGIAHTFVVKGCDEKLAPELCAVLKEANQCIPDDLRIMASKELKKRSRIKNEDTASDEELQELRKANREKQLLMNQQRQRGSRNKKGNSKGRGRK